MKKILTLSLAILFAFTLTSCEPTSGELTTFTPNGRITLLSLVKQLNPQDVMKACNIKKGDKRATSLYNRQLSCLRSLADSGHIVPMFTVANTDMNIYKKTKNPDALQESLLYLKTIIAFSRMPEFNLKSVPPVDRIIHQYDLLRLIRIANLASLLLFQNKNEKQAHLIENDIKTLIKHIKVVNKNKSKRTQLKRTQ